LSRGGAHSILAALRSSPCLFLSVFILACAKPGDAPDTKADAKAPATVESPSAPDARLARTDDGLLPVMNEMVAAAAAYATDKESALGTRLRPLKAWWIGEFGEKLGLELYTNYVSGEELGAESISTICGEMQRAGKTEIRVVKIESADDKNGNAFQGAALKAMARPIALYTVRFTKPGEPLGTTLWSFAKIDGEFRYLGRMYPLLETMRDNIADEVPRIEVDAWPTVDGKGHITETADPGAWDGALKDAVGLKAALLGEAKGKRVLLVTEDDQKLAARTIDGSVNRELAAGYNAVTFEPRLDLVWLGKNGRVDVLDLREDNPRPRAVVKLPKDVDGEILVRWSLGGVEGETDMAGGFGAGELTWSNEPRFERADLEGSGRGYKVVGDKWLASQLDRKSNALPEARFPTTGGALPCDGCARSVPFGATGLSLVPWNLPDLDGKRRFRSSYEHMRLCQLYDPATHKLGLAAGAFGPDRRPLSPTYATCGAYRFDPSGKALLIGSSACDESGCVTVAGFAEDWLIGAVPVILSEAP